MNRMLKVDKSLLSDEVGQKPAGPPAEGPRNFYLRVLRHQRPTVIVIMVLVMAIALIYLFTATPTYVGTAYMVIDTHQLQLLQGSAAGATWRHQCR
jgi:uncharacterized protein involved in exopolysaccharide biosynthesis